MQDSNTVQQYLNKNSEVVNLAEEKKINIFDAAFYSNTFFYLEKIMGLQTPNWPMFYYLNNYTKMRE